MKQKHQSLDKVSLAISMTILTSTISILAIIFAIISPSYKTITPFLQALYSPLGYSTSPTGAILGILYVAIDTFTLTYLFAWTYNKLL